MKRWKCYIVPLFVIILAGSPMTASGQSTVGMPIPSILAEDSYQSDADVYEFRSFRGRPGEYCQSFFITEAAYLYRIQRSGYFDSRDDRNFYFLGEAGWMKNLDNNNALGATFYCGFDDDGADLALKPRYRRWLNSDINLDASVGVIFWTFSKENKSPGLIAQLNLGYGDYFSIFTQFNYMNYKDLIRYNGHIISTSGKSEKIWYGGLKLGSYPGTAAWIIAPLAVIFYVYLK